jgi:hypothetical protein
LIYIRPNQLIEENAMNTREGSRRVERNTSDSYKWQDGEYKENNN